MNIEPSRRGEVIGFCALVLTAGIWWSGDRESKGAIAKAQEFNATLLSQRNREIDSMKEDERELRRQMVDCGKRL